MKKVTFTPVNKKCNLALDGNGTVTSGSIPARAFDGVASLESLIKII
jgi:hypothetical protein